MMATAEACPHVLHPVYIHYYTMFSMYLGYSTFKVLAGMFLLAKVAQALPFFFGFLNISIKNNLAMVDPKENNALLHLQIP